MRVFVYGTLKPGHANWHRLLRGRVSRWQAAKVPGRLLDLPVGYPAVVSGEGWVYGYVLHIPRPDLLAAVDALEGYDPKGPPERNEYQRRVVPACTPAGAPLGRVYAYFMDEEKARRLGGEEVPGGVWRPLAGDG